MNDELTSVFFILTDLWSKQKPIFWPMVSYTNLNLDFCLATQFCRANVLSIDIQTMAIKTPQPQRWRLLRAEVSILFSQWLLFFISDHKNVEQCKWGRHIQLSRIKRQSKSINLLLPFCLHHSVKNNQTMVYIKHRHWGLNLNIYLWHQ